MSASRSVAVVAIVGAACVSTVDEAPCADLDPVLASSSFIVVVASLSVFMPDESDGEGFPARHTELLLVLASGA